MQVQPETTSTPKSLKGEPFDFWEQPAVIAPNNFKFKSLSNWAFNISVGCSHACRFCYVPSSSTVKQGPTLKKFNVEDPDEEWGDYSLLRPWDEKKFVSSLKKAELKPVSMLKPDGNRAVIFCSTTDAYQTFRASTPTKAKLLNSSAATLVRKALETIRDQSTLNVRILTRSPLAKRDFDLFKSFGKRLIFGMSLPTLRHDLSRIYEPKAPAPLKRLETLQAAKTYGLNIYVAMAPTYPECDEADLRATLAAIKKLNPITIFHEPINIRAENVARIKNHAKELGVSVNTAVFADRNAWRQYALNSLMLVQRLAAEFKLDHCLHLWPDSQLKSKNCFISLRDLKRAQTKLTTHEKHRHAEEDARYYEKEYLPWLNGWWQRISEWPR